MTRRTIAALLLATPFLAGLTHTQGRLIGPPSRIRPVVQTLSTQVSTQITDGVADLTVKMRFRNLGGTQAEKILLLPLPKGATADGLEMEVGGKMTKGEVLASLKARGIYESIVRRRRDPALLEYMGRDCLRLRVFPIPPRGEQAVQVRVRLVLPESGGLYSFQYPVRAIDGGSFAMDVRIRSKTAIKNVYSPLSGWDIHRQDDHYARASFESKTRPQEDPTLFYGLSDRDFGLNLLTYRKAGKPGYFLAMLAPKRDWKQEKELRKSITFVIDTSGSMQGQKIEQAKRALKFFLRSLKPGDDFNLIPFSTEARPFANAPVHVDKEQLDKALAFVAEIEARGGTNIHEALTTALRSKPGKNQVPIVCFLTDGLPTVGNTNIQEILRDCRKENRSDARIFVFGVGDDVNTRLLDTLSSDFRGTRDYVRPGENIEVKVGALFEKIAYPVMADLSLSADKVAWDRVSPSKLPDLFRGSRLILVGRYRGSGPTAIRLKGKIGGEPKEFVFEGTFPDLAHEHDFVATLWARQRVGTLLEAIRLHGQNSELVSEIKRIGTEHGIVTPYTSHLIIEEGARIARNFGDRGLVAPTGGVRVRDARLREELKRAGAQAEAADLDDAAGEAAPSAPAASKSRRALGDLGKAQSGKKAVEDSLRLGRVAFTTSLSKNRHGSLWRTQRIGGVVLYFVRGTWIDGRFRKGHEKGLKRIEAFSTEYFSLLREHPRLRKVLAFSTSMLLIVDGKAIQIAPAKAAAGKK